MTNQAKTQGLVSTYKVTGDRTPVVLATPERTLVIKIVDGALRIDETHNGQTQSITLSESEAGFIDLFANEIRYHPILSDRPGARLHKPYKGQDGKWRFFLNGTDEAIGPYATEQEAEAALALRLTLKQR